MNHSPLACFDFNPKNPNILENVNFNASCSNDPDGDSLSYSWDFGDGQVDSGVSTNHLYSLEGTYSVTLSVNDGKGRTNTEVMEIRVTGNGNLNWSEIMTVSSGKNDRRYPRITADKNGLIWIVWTQLDSDWNIYAAYYDGSWSSAFPVTSSSGDDLEPSLSIDEYGNMWVAWYSTRNGNEDIYVRKKESGGTWGVEQRITRDSDNDETPFIFADGIGRVWLVWTRFKNDDANIYSRYFDGSWSAEMSVTSDPADDRWGTLTEDDSGKIWLAFQTFRNGNWDIYYSTYDNGWNPPQPAVKNPNDDYVVFADTDLNGNVWFSWHSLRDGNRNIYANYWTGSGWTEEVQITDYWAMDRTCVTTIAEDGDVWISWWSGDWNEFDVFSKCFNGSSWSNRYKVNEDSLEHPHTLSNPWMTTDLSGNIWYTWESNESRIWQIQARYFTEKATLSISCSPIASIYINNSYEGITPLDIELEKGIYEIRLENEGYESYTQTIELFSGESVSIQVELREIASQPAEENAVSLLVLVGAGAAVASGVGAYVLLGRSGIRAVGKVSQEAGKKVASEIGTKIAEEASKEIGTKIAEEASKEIGTKIAEEASKEIGTKIAEEASKEIGGKVIEGASKLVEGKAIEEASKEIGGKIAEEVSKEMWRKREMEKVRKGKKRKHREKQ
jgi:hypothetical protein